MKIGLIADIHADLAALELALALMEQHKVQKILCAGDLVDKGKDGNAVVQRIRDLKLPCVSGNHDSLAQATQEWYRRSDPQFVPSHLILRPENVAFLEALPHTLLIETPSCNILLMHATPWRNDIYLRPSTPRSVFERVAEAAHAQSAQVVVLGHTHIPMQVYVNGVLILNPGSVCGAYAQGSRTCGVLHLPERHFQVFDLDSGKPVHKAQLVDDYMHEKHPDEQ